MCLDGTTAFRTLKGLVSAYEGTYIYIYTHQLDLLVLASLANDLPMQRLFLRTQIGTSRSHLSVILCGFWLLASDQFLARASCSCICRWIGL